jgi:hypothetical protein
VLLDATAGISVDYVGFCVYKYLIHHLKPEVTRQAAKTNVCFVETISCGFADFAAIFKIFFNKRRVVNMEIIWRIVK